MNGDDQAIYAPDEEDPVETELDDFRVEEDDLLNR